MHKSHIRTNSKSKTALGIERQRVSFNSRSREREKESERENRVKQRKVEREKELERKTSNLFPLNEMLLAEASTVRCSFHFMASLFNPTVNTVFAEHTINLFRSIAATTQKKRLEDSGKTKMMKIRHMHNVFKAHKLYAAAVAVVFSFFIVFDQFFFYDFLCLLQSFMALKRHWCTLPKQTKRTESRVDFFFSNRLYVHCERGSNKIDVDIVGFCCFIRSEREKEIFYDIACHLSPVRPVLCALVCRHTRVWNTSSSQGSNAEPRLSTSYRATPKWITNCVWINLTLSLLFSSLFCSRLFLLRFVLI